MKRLALMLLLATPAAAQDKPATIPTRDVDVTYRMVQPVAGGPPLMQRMRWSVAAGKLRVDPPSPSLYMIVDYKAHRMEVVRPADHAVLDLDAAGPGLPASPAGRFTRLGGDTVAGQGCTNWETTDSAGKTVSVCITAEGVMLRASQGANVLLEATTVSFASQDPAAFQPPDGFRHIKQGDP